MKVQELKKVRKNRVGVINKNDTKPEPNEEETYKYLTLYGFNIELIKPSNTKKTKNPDVLIMGAIWEVKTPISSKENTIKNRFREAAKQSTKIIFDLRFVKKDANKVEKMLIGLLKKAGGVRRMIIIEKDGTAVDLIK